MDGDGSKERGCKGKWNVAVKSALVTIKKAGLA